MGSFYELTTMIFVISAVLCYIPSYITATKSLKKIYPFITVTAAGFMLAMLLMDFVPHVTKHSHAIAKPTSENDEKKVGHSEDQCTDSSCKDHRHTNDGSGGHTHSHYDDTRSNFQKKFGLFVAGLSFILLLAIDSCFLHHSHCDNEDVVHMNDGINHGPHPHDHCHGCPEDGDEENIKSLENNSNIQKSAKTTETPCMKTIESLESKDAIIQIEQNKENVPKKADKHDHSHEHQMEGGCNTSAIKDTKSRLQVMIFIIAISVHSLFEGFAIKSDSQSLYKIGIIIHKALESFALGFTISLAEFTHAYKVILITVYSALTPIGMLISHFLDQCQFEGNVKDYVTNGCNGLSLGSLIFVVCIEMIPPNFHSKGANLSKVFALTFGYLLTSVLVLFFSDNACCS